MGTRFLIYYLETIVNGVQQPDSPLQKLTCHSCLLSGGGDIRPFTPANKSGT